MEDNRKLNNVMYIELFTERLLEITNGAPDPVEIKPQRGAEETTEITDIDHTSFFQERAKVRDQIEYEYLITDRKNDRG